MPRYVVLLIAVSAASSMLVAAATSGAQEVDPGERIMNAACQGCHDVRVIQVQAMDADGWGRRV